MTVVVFAKPPRPGEVKTRLIPALGPEGAAELAAAFLADVTEALAPVLVAGPELQEEGDLGARLERVLAPRLPAIAVGTDSPGLPRRFLDEARAALDEVDAVLGPTPDGGFYLLGLRRCPPGLLAELPWSSPDTLAATLRRLAGHGLTSRLLPPFFDVDVPRDLGRLRAWLDATGAAPRTRALLEGVRPRLSVVVPVLDEERRIGERLEELGRTEGIDEVVVVDGGSTDRTVAIAERYAVRVVSAPRGRAAQLNAGARAATGEVLLFLHADVSLPRDAADHVEAVLAGHESGCFRTWTVAEEASWLGPLLHLADVRSRVTRHPYGDQAIFVRREVFEEVGGFPEIALMEDYALSRRLAERGPIGLAPARVRVSGRRFLARPLRYTTIMWTWPALFRWGVSPETLARWYRHER